MARMVYTSKFKRLIIYAISIFIIYKLFSKLSVKKKEPEKFKPDINLNLYGPKKELNFTPKKKERKNVFHFATQINPKTEIKEYARQFKFTLTQVERMDKNLKICEKGNKNCNAKVEEMCNSYDFLIFSDILYEARPFIKANCRAKIILHLTRPFDDFVPEDDKESFTNLLRKALSTEKVTVVVPYRAYLYDACDRGLEITKYINIQASPFSPNIKNSYVQTLAESNPKANQTVAVFNRYFQEKLLIDVFQKNGIEYEKLDFDYGGPEVLSKYKAIVHLPYTPAPNSLMENICNGVMIFIPTREFLQELHGIYSDKIEMSTFNRYLDLRKDQMSMIYECFDPYIGPHVSYFSDWKNLVTKLNKFSSRNRKIMKRRNKEFAIYQRQKNSYYWKTLLGYGNENIQSIFQIDEIPYCKMKTKEERIKLRNKQRKIEIAARKKKKPSNKKYDNQLS